MLSTYFLDTVNNYGEMHSCQGLVRGFAISFLTRVHIQRKSGRLHISHWNEVQSVNLLTDSMRDFNRRCNWTVCRLWKMVSAMQKKEELAFIHDVQAQSVCLLYRVRIDESNRPTPNSRLLVVKINFSVVHTWLLERRQKRIKIEFRNISYCLKAFIRFPFWVAVMNRCLMANVWMIFFVVVLFETLHVKR